MEAIHCSIEERQHVQGLHGDMLTVW
uniref:Uncharacterized protein n=1 Tax=Arundo donax TaxID=35708 RepID=A0A0A9E416_ARUDO